MSNYKMKKTIIFVVCTLLLSACGNDSRELNNIEQKVPLKLYSIDGFTGEYDLNELLLFSAIYSNGKTYEIDENKKIYIKYQDIPIFKTEVLKQIITPHSFFSMKSPHLSNYQYLLGEQSNFDGMKLSYKLKNKDETELLLSWDLEKINVSGQQIRLDLNNPIHKIKSGSTSDVFAATLGIGYTDLDVFPKGSLCWQKKKAHANLDYIEFYPNKIVRHVSEENKIIRTNIWGGLTWSEYEMSIEETGLANIKVVNKDKVYWGWLQPQSKEFLPNPNEFRCDFMNEIAYDVVIPKLNKYREALVKDNLDPTIFHSMWSPGYIDNSELNPIRSETEGLRHISK